MSLVSQRHIKNLIFDTVAEAQANGRKQSICYVKETNTFYAFVDWAPVTVDGTTTLSTGNGGFTRWIAKAGYYAPASVGDHEHPHDHNHTPLIIALGF